MIEEWKDIPACSGYRASSFGRIRSGRSLKIMRPSRNYSGYLVCEVWHVQHRVNRLVCTAFHGEAPSIAHQAAHKDGDKANNRADNLYWATPQQNSNDMKLHGTVIKGRKHAKALLIEADIRSIRKLRKDGMSIVQIRTIYSHVCYATLSHICNRRTWKHVE